MNEISRVRVGKTCGCMGWLVNYSEDRLYIDGTRTEVLEMVEVDAPCRVHFEEPGS